MYKIFLIVCGLFMGVVTCVGQRFVLLPQTLILSKNNPVAVSYVNIDYFFDPSSSEPMVLEQVYNTEDIFIKTAQTTATWVAKEAMVGNISFLSVYCIGGKLTLKLNTKTEITKNELTVIIKQPIFLGSSSDNKIQNAQLIFKNWGMELSQSTYNDYAKVLDVLMLNNAIFMEPNIPNQLTLDCKNRCEYLVKQLDLSLVSGKTFKQLVTEKVFILDEKNRLSRANSEILKTAYLYEKTLQEAQNTNVYSQNFSNDSLMHLWKDTYYSTFTQLADFNRDKKQFKDTLINGTKHLLMLAFKPKTFQNYLKKLDNGTQTYTSYEKLFVYPFFLTTRQEVKQYCLQNGLDNLSEEACKVRLQQLLGLPPLSTNELLVEFWVKESDIFRPTLDSSLAGTGIFLRPDTHYVSLFQKFSQDSYRNDNIFKQYPFTGLGYTWNYSDSQPTHFGASEFVLRENRTIFIRKIVAVKPYIHALTKE